MYYLSKLNVIGTCSHSFSYFALTYIVFVSCMFRELFLGIATITQVEMFFFDERRIVYMNEYCMNLHVIK